MSITLGLCIPEGKKNRICFPDRIQELCLLENIRIVEIDVNEDLETQGPYHVLLHKVLDFHNETDADNAHQKINKIIRYSQKHKEMAIIDDFNWCMKLTNRKCMIELIKKCEFTLNNITVLLPKTLEVTEKMSSHDIVNLMRKTGMKWPVISKSYSAYFDDGAHDMSLIFSIDAINQLKKPCLLQEFCNHGGVLYKVFVVDHDFKICERPSIKDFNITKKYQSTIYFDSFRVSKTGKPFIKALHASDPNRRHWFNCDERQNLLDIDVTQELVSRIHEQTGLYLYGFDILVDKETGNYALVDLNQFPSYSGVEDSFFPISLVKLIKSFAEAL